MATTSTPDQNDPTADNRAEYAMPPVAEEAPEGIEFDADGSEVGTEPVRVPAVMYTEEELSSLEEDNSEVIENGDTLAS